MNLLSLSLLLTLPTAAAPGVARMGSRPPLRDARPALDGALLPWSGALPTTCDAPPAAPAAIARLAKTACAALEGATRVVLPGGPTATTEVRVAFDYEPASWLIVHRVEASDGARHVVEFWPADPRELPGSSAHDAYVVVSQWIPDGDGTRGISFKLRLDGRAEPQAWTVDAGGGAHAPLTRADVRRRLDEELAFWSRR